MFTVYFFLKQVEVYHHRSSFASWKKLNREAWIELHFSLCLSKPGNLVKGQGTWLYKAHGNDAPFWSVCSFLNIQRRHWQESTVCCFEEENKIHESFFRCCKKYSISVNVDELATPQKTENTPINKTESLAELISHGQIGILLSCQMLSVTFHIV